MEREDDSAPRDPKVHLRSSKLYHFARHLSIAEQAAFALQLKAPHFNARPEAEDLWRVFAEKVLAPEGDLSEETCFEIAFPEKPYNKIWFRKLKSFLLELLLRFWEGEAWQHMDAERAIARLEKMLDLNEDRFFHQYQSTAEKAVAQHNDTIAGLLMRRQLCQIRYRHEVRLPRRRPGNTLVLAQDLLERYSIAESVRIAYIASIHTRVTGEAIALEPTADQIAYFIERQAEFPAEAQGYFLLLLCQKQPEIAAWYRQLKELLSFEALPPPWAQDLLTGALNFAMWKYNSGQVEFLWEIVEWYKRCLVEGVLVEGGRLLAGHLKNAVSVAGKSDECDWGEQLVDRFAADLLGAYGNNAEYYNRGVLAFYRGNYKAAIRSFYKVLQDFEDEFYGLDARIFLLQAYYLKMDWQPIDSQLAAFRMYIRRCKTVNVSRRKRYLTYLRFFRRLVHTPEFETDRRQRLREELESSSVFPARDWLLSQVK